MQAIKRVTVAGETTGGGAHLTRMQHIDDHFARAVPFARPVNPTTKTDWEGKGVTPDVTVKAAEALETAHRLAENKLRQSN